MNEKIESGKLKVKNKINSAQRNPAFANASAGKRERRASRRSKFNRKEKKTQSIS
jgi:hypothetical protein